MYDATISRNEAWNFGKLGQVLERADDKTSRFWIQKYHLLLDSPQSVGFFH
jgi:uncharacterized alpha-E superfamily protein